MIQTLPRFTADAAGQVYRDGQLYCQIALCVPPFDREKEAQRIAYVLNAVDALPPRRGRRLFGDSERHEFLRPSDAPARSISLGGRESGSLNLDH